jgi:hypothetical protein
MNSFDPTEIRSTIKWYFESKNVALRKALQIRGSLSGEQHNDLRVFYSQYITSLVSAVEVLLEKEYPFSAQFRDVLYREFVTDGHQDGEKNYAYLKELRNSIVHRGEDIAGRGSLMDSGQHLLHVPAQISTRNGKVTYQAFSPLLLGVAALAEHLIGGIILRNFQANEILQPRTDFDSLRTRMQAYVSADPTIPGFVKQHLPNMLSSIDLQKVEEENTASLISLLSSGHPELLSAIQEVQNATPTAA